MCCFPYLPQFAAECRILEVGVRLCPSDAYVNVHIGNTKYTICSILHFTGSERKSGDTCRINAWFHNNYSLLPINELIKHSLTDTWSVNNGKSITFFSPPASIYNTVPTLDHYFLVHFWKSHLFIFAISWCKYLYYFIFIFWWYKYWHVTA